MAAEVIIYTTPYCPYCIRAKMHLRNKGVDFQEVNVSGDTSKRAWLVEVTGRKTVPQIFIDGTSIGGCDDLLEMDRQGRLDPMLKGSLTSEATHLRRACLRPEREARKVVQQAQEEETVSSNRRAMQELES